MWENAAQCDTYLPQRATGFASVNKLRILWLGLGEDLVWKIYEEKQLDY
jgi:hypothetical protein